jgi:saccharopine dehydrogenase-like NADP-dependent oxidoreductase
MKQILILGAGRSSSSLIDRLLSRAPHVGFRVTVGDLDVRAVEARMAAHPHGLTHGSVFPMELDRTEERDARIAASDLVISMVPAAGHPAIAAVAIAAGVPVITPSYIAPEMAALDGAARAAGVLVLCELGLDPGIDHLSAMALLADLRAGGAQVTHFESYCGGLPAPASDTNPWHYKFSWAPRNVVVAGQSGTSTFLAGGMPRAVPPHRVFRTVRPVEVAGVRYDGYPNRDSLAYTERYGLDGVDTLIRGTLRGEGFCAAWDVLVGLGCVRDDVRLEWPEGTSWAEWLRTFVPDGERGGDLRAEVAGVTGAGEEALDRLAWLGLFDGQEGPGACAGTPADILQGLLERRWRLEPGDRDLIVLVHRIEYVQGGQRYEAVSSLVREGRDTVFTAMSDTVGWPIAVAAEVLLAGGFGRTGVEAPLAPVYAERLLPELEALGIRFEESRRAL